VSTASRRRNSGSGTGGTHVEGNGRAEALVKVVAVDLHKAFAELDDARAREDHVPRARREER
jgi:hypothetical protein